MNEIDCIKRMADHYPGGLKAVALRLAISHEVLRKQLAGAHGFKLGLIDAMAIVRMCAELGAMHSTLFAVEVAATHNMRLVPLSIDEDEVGSVVHNATSAMRASTSLATEIIERSADGGLCDNDMKVIEKSYAQSVSKKQRAIRSARAAHAAGKSKLGRGA